MAASKAILEADMAVVAWTRKCRLTIAAGDVGPPCDRTREYRCSQQRRVDHQKERDEKEAIAGQAELARHLHVDIRHAMQLGDEKLGALAIRTANSIAQPREMHAGPGSRTK